MTEEIDQSAVHDGSNDRVFSFACFPIERIIIMTGMMAGPGIAAGVWWNYQRGQELAYRSVSGAIELVPSGDSRLLVGLTLLLALVLVLYGWFYLQLRAGTRVYVSSRGVRYVRSALLPFDALTRDTFLSWSSLDHASFRSRRGLLGAKPEVLLEWSTGRLRLSVADAWDEADGKRPYAPKRPKGGWESHPLTKTLLEGHAAAG